MIHPNKWWIGLLPLFLIWLLANWFNTVPIERDLTSRAGEAIAGESFLNKSQISVAGRDVTVSGEAFAPTGASQALDAARATRGVRLAVDATKSLASVKPFDWSVKRDGNTVLLSGHVPNPGVRAKIAAAAKSAFTGCEIKDEMTYASGGTAGFESAAAFGIGQLATLSNGSVSLADGNFSIAGKAPTSAVYDSVLAATKKLPEGMNLAKVDITPPEMKPYIWSAALNGKTVTLEGAAPSIEASDKIAAAAVANFPGLTIANNLQIARGAPSADFLPAVEGGLQQLTKLIQGKVSLQDDQLSVSGAVKPDIGLDQLQASIRSTLPPGFKLAEIDVTPPRVSPYTFGANKADGTLTLSGYYPDNKTHQEIVDVTKRLFGGDQIMDKLAVGAGAPAGFADAVRVGLTQLARLATGTFALSDIGMKLSGDAFHQNAADEIGRGFPGALPTPYSVNLSVGVKAPEPEVTAESCQQLFADLLSKTNVLFETDTATLSQDSIGLLDNFVAIAKRCPQAKIEIAGYTDSVGSEEYNLDLSKRRAQAVVDYLVKEGITAGNLSTIGYGATHPVASNDSDEGRAQNRRIEIHVK